MPLTNLLSHQSVFDNAVVQRAFGARDGDNVVDTLEARMVLFWDCINSTDGYKKDNSASIQVMKTTF